jgi:hypothetical protein
MPEQGRHVDGEGRKDIQIWPDGLMVLTLSSASLLADLLNLSL